MSDEKQYWINQGGEQQGPFTAEQLEKQAISPDAYVWSVGFDDWMPIGQVPALAHLLSGTQQQEQLVGADSGTVSTPPPIESEPVMGQPVEQPVLGQPIEQTVVGQPVYPVQLAQGQSAQGQQPYPPCPPTNLVWAIISTVLCCLPTGIVAIYYATKVSKKYYEGDLAAAEHYSEVGAWWCIGTIIAGIVLSPLVSLVQMAMMP